MIDAEQTEQFEYPLPIVKTDAESIDIETQGHGGEEGSFTVKNAGGGELWGNITSNSRSISFTPVEFRGNSVVISYRLHLDIYKTGDTVKTEAIIMSNGGEIIIPVTIKITPPAIQLSGGGGLSSLEDFGDYAGNFPAAARKLFTRQEFMAWLINMGYKHMEIYEHFAADPNKERAVDNFLVFNGLKRKAAIYPANLYEHIVIHPGAGAMAEDGIAGGLGFMKKEDGYGEAFLTVTTGGEWLKLNRARLTTGDFNSAGYGEADYILLPGKLKRKNAFAKVEVSSAGEKTAEIIVQVTRQTPFSAHSDKEIYGFDDAGFIHIVNGAGRDLMLEIIPSDNFLRFEGARYFIGGRADIPFSVKIGGMLTQMSLKKQAGIDAWIQVKSLDAEFLYSKIIQIQINGLK